jgi:hypothetical protein
MAIVKVLIVTDDLGGFQRSNTNPHKFHLGEFVKVLTDTDWQGFTLQITRAHRSANPSPATPQATHPIGADLYGFRFSAASLAGFDMCFFLSIASKAEDPVGSDANRQAEAAAVAAFMESGGGFFATGDHEDLGAAINQHIPRVRSMRRWASPAAGPHGGPVAPSGTEGDRHDTLQRGTDSGTHNGVVYPYQFNDQSDGEPQPIDVRSYTLHSSRWFRSSLPHPLLCSPLGRVNVLPDHMHEGWCEVPSDLSRNEDLPGRSGKPEYPLGIDGIQVEPEVIAEANVLPHETHNQEFGGSFAVSPMTGDYSFGVIAAYDGHRANIGRVVVDATWHHFVNINLIGTSASFAGLNPSKAKGFYSGPGDTPVPAYEKIMWYFRNLVYWLIPKNRTHIIWLNELAQAARLNPRWEEFKVSRFHGDYLKTIDLRHIIGFAQLAEGYFNSVRGFCVQFHLLPIILYPIWKFDPRIWEDLMPELDPWNPVTQALSRKIKPLDTWRQGLLPDARLRRQVLLGTLVIAATQQLQRLEEADEKSYLNVQKQMLELLPRHLELAAAELEAGIKATQQLTGSLKALAAAAQQATPEAIGRQQTGRKQPAPKQATTKQAPTKAASKKRG